MPDKKDNVARFRRDMFLDLIVIGASLVVLIITATTKSWVTVGVFGFNLLVWLLDLLFDYRKWRKAKALSKTKDQ